MIALDTNILARHLLADGPAAHQQAAGALLAAQGPCWIAVTVFLELAWALEGAGKSRAEIAGAMRGVLALQNVKAQHHEAVSQAIERFHQGLDFADALHLALCGAAAAELVTFDAPFARRAGALATVPPVRLLTGRAR